MPAVTMSVILEPKKIKSVTVFIVSPAICPDLSFLNVEFFFVFCFFFLNVEF